MSRHAFTFPINAIVFNLCYLNPFRSKKVWIYGARAGMKYDENSMHMFEYMNSHHQEIRSIWMTSSPSAYQIIKSKGYEVEYNESLRGKLLQLKAGVVLYSHSLNDFGSIPLVGGSELVALWHGMGFKKIYNGKYTGLKLKLKKFIDHIYSRTRRTMTLVTSEYAKRWVMEMFTLNSREIYITGQPRNDCFKFANRCEILDGLGIEKSKRVAIFMPTYRMPSMGSDAMANIIKDLYNCKELNEVLDKTNTVFLVKLHPITPHIEIDNRDNFKVFDYAAVESNQELMGVCDILITDYSSCFVDYALLERPIIFYNPDNEEFLSKSETMSEGFFQIADMNRAWNPSDLAGKLLNPSMAAVNKTNEVFEDPKIKNTCYSENVYNAIIKKIGVQ